MTTKVITDPHRCLQLCVGNPMGGPSCRHDSLVPGTPNGWGSSSFTHFIPFFLLGSHYVLRTSTTYRWSKPSFWELSGCHLLKWREGKELSVRDPPTQTAVGFHCMLWSTITVNEQWQEVWWILPNEYIQGREVSIDSSYISTFQVVICSFRMLSSYTCFIKSSYRVFRCPHTLCLPGVSEKVFPTELTTAICLAKTPLILLQFMLRFFFLTAILFLKVLWTASMYGAFSVCQALRQKLPCVSLFNPLCSIRQVKSYHFHLLMRNPSLSKTTQIQEIAY